MGRQLETTVNSLENCHLTHCRVPVNLASVPDRLARYLAHDASFEWPTLGASSCVGGCLMEIGDFRRSSSFRLRSTCRPGLFIQAN